MKPSEVAEILADRVRRDTNLEVHTSPEFYSSGTLINVVFDDPEISLDDTEERALGGTPFSAGVQMDWEVLLYYSRDNWNTGKDVLYDILDSLTANLEKPLASETKQVDAIVEKIMSATRPETEEGEGLGIQKIVTLKTLTGG